MAGVRVGRVAERRASRTAMGRAPMVKMSRRMPAHAGRGALVRLDGAGVVVALDLERHRQAVADADDAGVLAQAGHHAAAGVGRRREQRLGALVGAVLAPHHAEHRQLHVVGVAAEASRGWPQLLVGQAEARGGAASRGSAVAAAGRLLRPSCGRRWPGRCAPTSERISSSPSAEPRSGSAAAPGGASGRNVARRLMTPAMSRASRWGCPLGPARSREDDATARLQRVQRRVVGRK